MLFSALKKQRKRWLWKNNDLLGQEIHHLLSVDRSISVSISLSLSTNRSSSWSLSLSLSLSLSNQPVTPKFTQLGIWVSYHRVLCFDFRGRGMTLKCFLFLFYKFFLFSFNSKIIKKKSKTTSFQHP